MKQLSVIGFVVLGMASATGCVEMTDDAATAEQADAIQRPASVVSSGGRCGVSWSFDHSATSGSTGAAFFKPTAQSTVMIDRDQTIFDVVSVDHIDSVSVTPSALAANQVPVSATVRMTQTAGTAAPVVASALWSDVAQFQSGNLCTGSATSTIVVHISSGSTCTETKTTNFPTCLSVR